MASCNGSWGANLRRYREARAISQEDFGDVLGCHRTYVGGLERGERNLTLKSVERIAATIKVDPLELLAEASATGEAGVP